MHTSSKVTFRRSAGNLHISLKGQFDGMCAWELIKTIGRQYAGSGRVFIGTAGLNAVLPSGTDLFRKYVNLKVTPASILFFKGEKGFSIAPDGARVMIRKKHDDQRRPPLRLCSACEMPVRHCAPAKGMRKKLILLRSPKRHNLR